MQLKLKWRNPNTLATTVSLYRNDTAVPAAELGAPIVTLNGTVTEWLDNNVILGKTYFYTWKTENAGNSVFTKPLEVKAEYSLGPGPSELLYGDMSLGYFGTVPYTELFTAQEILTMTKVNSGVYSNGLVYWDKFARNGKVLYTPTAPISVSCTWQAIYRAGCVFGVDGPGPWRTPNWNAEAVNQLTKISKLGNDFIIRLPTGLDDRNNPERTAKTINDSRRYSEVADLQYSRLDETCPSLRIAKIAQMNVTGLFGGLATSMCQEQDFADKNSCVTSGTTTSNKTGIQIEAYSSIVGSSSSVWLPVLELIPNKIMEVTL